MQASARKYPIEGHSAPQPQPKHILLLGGLAASLTNFRGPLIKTLLAAGHRVTAAAGDDDAEVEATLKTWGAQFETVRLARAGMNPLGDLSTMRDLVALMRRTKPDIFLGYTIKPVTYGLIAARIASVPRRFAMVTGLGYAFTDGPELKRLAARVAALGAYRLSLRYADKVIFQNPDDEAFFLESGLLRDKAQAARVNGSGVDLNRFTLAPLPEGPITFLMIARLLRDKGVYEYVEAARIVKRQHPEARFVLVGPLDPNPAAIKQAEVEAWVKEGVIDYRGAVRDVRPEIAACHVYVLPSYREGMPRTVLEAMAMGRAIITTDVPGCRETIEDGVSGLLVPARNAAELANAMSMFTIAAIRINAFAFEARLQVEQKFESASIATAIETILTKKITAKHVRAELWPPRTNA